MKAPRTAEARAETDLPPGITRVELDSPRWALVDHDGRHEYVTGKLVDDPPDPGRLSFFWPVHHAWTASPEAYRGLVYVGLTDAERRLGADPVAVAVALWTSAWSRRLGGAGTSEFYRAMAAEESDMGKVAELRALIAEYETAERCAPRIRRKEFSDEDLDVTVHEPTPWIVEDLLAPGLTLLAAPPKMGKSYFVLQLAQCVGAGRPFLGRNTRQVKVSYFDLEEWEELLKVRRDKIRKGNSILPGQTKVRYAMEMTGGDVTVLEDMQRHVGDGAELIILDLLARVRDELTEDAKKNAYARDYAALKKFADFVLKDNPHLAIVIVHHTNKGSHDDWQSSISGSHGLAGATHTNMLMHTVDLRALDDAAKAKAKRYRELHVVGKQVEQLDMMVRMMDNGGGWEVTEDTLTDVRTTTKCEHILQLLRETPGRVMSAPVIARAMQGPGSDLPEPTKNEIRNVGEILRRQIAKGRVESVSGPEGGYFVRPDPA